MQDIDKGPNHQPEKFSALQIDQEIITLITNSAIPEDFEKYFLLLKNNQQDEFTNQHIFNISLNELSTIMSQEHFFSFRSKKHATTPNTTNHLLWRISKYTPIGMQEHAVYSGYVFIGRTVATLPTHTAHHAVLSDKYRPAFLGSSAKPIIPISSDDPLQEITNILRQDITTRTLLLDFTQYPQSEFTRNSSISDLAYAFYDLIVPQDFRNKTSSINSGRSLFENWELIRTLYNDFTDPGN